MILILQLYPEVGTRVIETLFTGPIHGSTVRDYFIDHARGRFCVDDHAEKLLLALVKLGAIRPTHKDPTHSQAAFIGLQYSNSTYPRELLVPGTVEHCWFALTPEGRELFKNLEPVRKSCENCIRGETFDPCCPRGLCRECVRWGGLGEWQPRASQPATDSASTSAQPGHDLGA